MRIKRADFPEAIAESIYQRMRAERSRIANRDRAEGEEASLRIRATADRTAVEIRSEAQRNAQIIRGEAEAQAISIFAEALEEDPEFYRFQRSLEAYKKFLTTNTTVVLPADSDLFYFLQSPEGSGLPVGPPTRPRAVLSRTVRQGAEGATNLPLDDSHRPTCCPAATARHTVDVHAFEQFHDVVSVPHVAQVARRALDLEAAFNPSLSQRSNRGRRHRKRTERGLSRNRRGDGCVVLCFRSEGEYYGEGEPVFRQDDDAAFVTPDWAGSELGEVIVSYPQTLRQAERAGRDPHDELDHLVAHGVLHLLGYDHMNDEEEAEMRAKEALILGEHPADE